MRLGTLSVGIQADGVGQFNAAIDSAKHKTESFSSSSAQSFGAVEGMIRRVGAAALAVAGGYGIGQLSQSFLQAATTAENYALTLNVVLKSQSEANRIFKDMLTYSLKVPFEYEKIMQSATALSAVMKGGVDEVKQWMPLIGDLSAVTKSLGISFEETAVQVIRMYSAGAASADLFREKGVLAMLGFKAGVEYTAKDTQRLLMEAWNDVNSKFKGATDELAKTWQGMWSNMLDYWYVFRNMVMDSEVFNVLKTGLQSVLASLEEFRTSGAMQEFADNTARNILNAMKLSLEGIKAFAVAWSFGWESIKETFGMPWFNEHIIQPLKISWQWLKDCVTVAKEFYSGKDSPFSDKAVAAANKTAEAFDKQIGKIDSALANIGKHTQQTEANTGAVKRNTEAHGDNSKALEKVAGLLQDAKDIIAKQNLDDYHKKLYDINQKYKEQADKLAKELNPATKEYAAALKLIKQAKIVETTQATNDELKRQAGLVKDIDKAIKEMNGATVGSGSNRMLVGLTEEDLKILEDMKGQVAQMTDEQVKDAIDGIKERHDASKEAAEEQIDLMKEQEDAAKETYDNMASFFRDALTQMGNDAGSFIDMLTSKLKNMAASLAANALASIAMQAGGSLASFMGIGGTGASGVGGTVGGFPLSLLTGGGGGGSGMSLGNIVGMGKTGYSLFSGGGGSLSGIYNSMSAGYAPGAIVTDSAGNIVGTSGGMGLQTSWMGVGAGAVGLGAGGYGLYQGYKSGSPVTGALGGASAAFGGMTMAMALGAELGSTVPVVGTIIGAIVGAIVGALGMSGASAEKRRARRAEDYGKEFNRAASYDVSKGSLSDYMGGAESMLDKKSLYSFMKLGGISAEGSDELYRMIDFAKQYKKAIEETGETSAQTIGQYQRLTTEMKWFNATAIAWEGKAAGVAEGFKKIADNIKQLQLKAVTEDLDQGIGVFSYNMQKLEKIGLEGDALTNAQYEQTLKFLTDDAYPALEGELTKARETFKQAAYEMDRLSRAEEDAAIKAKILRSDLELTEQQLEGLRTGEVNNAMIELYTAMGEYDRELKLVIVDENERLSMFEALQEGAESMIGTLDRMREQYKDMDVSDSLRKTFTAIYQTATAVQILGEAGQKVEDLPDTFRAMKDALQAGDIVALNTELLKLSDTLLYLSGVAEMANMTKLAASFAATGNVVAGVFLLIEGAQVAKQGLDFLYEAAYKTERGKSWIDDRIEKLKEGGRLQRWWAEQMEKAVAPAASTPGTLRDAMGLGNMSVGEAGSVYQRYQDEAKYGGMSDAGAQAAQIQDEANRAVSALNLSIKTVFEEAAADGKVTAEEQANYRQYIADVTEYGNAIKEGAQDKIQQLKDDWSEGMDDIINTTGLTEAGKQVYELNKWYEEQKQVVKDLGLSEEQLNAAYDAQKQAIIDGVMQPVKDVIATAGMSDYEKSRYYIERQVTEQQEALQDMLDAHTISYEEYIAGMSDIAEESRILYDQLERQEQKRQKQLLKSLDSIIDTAGMDDLNKQLYQLNQWYEEQKENVENLVGGMDKLNAAYAVQRQQILEQFFQPLIDSIAARIQDLETGSFNIIAPNKRNALLSQSVDEAFAAMSSASPGKVGSAYQSFDAAAQAFLQQSLQMNQGNQNYLDDYNRIMGMYGQAQSMVEGMAGNYNMGYTEYENESVQNLVNISDYTRQTADTVTEALGDVPELVTAVKDQRREIQAMTFGLAQVERTLAGHLTELRAINKNTWYTGKNTNETVRQLVLLGGVVNSLKSNTFHVSLKR